MLHVASDGCTPDANAARAAAALTPTAAPSLLGGIAGGLLALEVQKLLDGEVASSLVGRELLCGLRHHGYTLTQLRRNPACRFDHVQVRAEITGDQTLGKLLAAAGPGASLSVEGDAFGHSLICRACRREERSVFRLVKRLSLKELRCRRCGAPRWVTGFDRVQSLDSERVPAVVLVRSLRELGLRDGDFFRIASSAAERWYELSADGAEPRSAPLRRGAALIGCGNIGSEALAHLARLRGIEKLVLVDHDAYELANLAGQRIARADVGRPKVEVQAERARELAPGLEIEAICSRIELVPPGRLRGLVLAAGVDTRAARQSLSELACRLGAHYVDAAIDARESLVRIRSYFTGPDTACYVCDFGAVQWASLEQEYACGAAAAADLRYA